MIIKIYKLKAKYFLIIMKISRIYLFSHMRINVEARLGPPISNSKVCDNSCLDRRSKTTSEYHNKAPFIYLFYINSVLKAHITSAIIEIWVNWQSFSSASSFREMICSSKQIISGKYLRNWFSDPILDCKYDFILIFSILWFCLCNFGMMSQFTPLLWHER